ncbi:Detected protein of unknown function [Hibiscus syriacus]|uniref:Uncharacterized protein n=1 Tax=Hibiscus syriacus TaxID=106335 RepID=A0A6A2Y8H4_HIBSY|nr:uncharacterized protein LOC120163000 [Hibiscus syriacus]XP_039028966.1 uncharacterized protein LOC120163000 [Hibiscus syriacus]KAE8678245.1 Detected protein of unknown function [Hibiscus syriacus]
MMGFGPYGGNAHGSGGSSNLSALAPPFTVDRSIIKPMVTPLVDVAEPLNWLDSNPFSFNSPQPGQLPMLDLEPIPTPSYNKNSDLFEPKTYYSPYVSQTLHPPTFNEHNLSGLELTAQWGGGWWDWEKRNPAQLGGSFYPKEASVAPPTIYTDHISLGPHPSSSLKTCEVTTHNNYSLVRESKVGPPDIETLDYSPVLGQNFSYMPVDYLKTSVIGPSSAPPESNLQVPPLNPVNVKNNQVPLSTSYEKPVRQLSNAPSDIPVLKSSPGVVIRPAAADACPLVSHAVPFKNFDSGINRNDTILTGNNLSSVNEYHYLLNFGSKNDSDPSQPSSHLDGNSYLSGESSASRSEKLSTSNMASKDASDLLFREKSGDASSRVTPNNFSLALNDTEPVTAMENSLESSDHFNPHVDSPCWKGAPYSHISPFESSEPVSVQPVNKLEVWDGSTGQALNFIPTNAANTVKLPSGKQNKIATTVEHGNMEHDLVSSLTFPSFSIPLFKEHSDDVGKTGSNQKKTGSACGIKFSQDAREQKKDFVLFNKPVDMIERASCNIQQSLAEGRLASKNVPTSETGVAYHERTSDVSGCGSSHMSCHAVKDLSCFPSSVEDISTNHSKCLGQEPVSNSSISVLLSTMQNLSELLLYQYLNETCELQDKDIKSLEKIIKNLDTCMPKNTEKKSFFSDLDEGTSKGRPQMAAIDVLSQHVQEKEKLSGNGDVKFPEFVSVETGAHGKAKNDKMAQAIKKILIDNFHEKEEANPQVNLYKNLWLEAEAALCSVNYMARFYNMKVELGKCKLDSGEDVSKESPDDDKISGSKVPVDINTNKLTAVAESGSISAVSSNQDSPIRNSSYHADAVTAKFSVEVNADAKLTAVAESGPILATSNQNSHIRNSSNGNSVDDLAARFQVLRQRLNNSNSVHTRDVDELTSSKLSLDLDKVDELAPEVKYSLTSGMQSPDSLVPVTACHTNDVEASVMARFHILKSSDIDDLDSNEMKRKLLPKVVDLGFAGKRRQISIDEDTAVDGVSGVNPKPVSQNQGANHDAEQVVTKDFHPCVQYDCSVQSPGSTRLGAQVSDNCSSDWEHVLKEELSGQNN